MSKIKLADDRTISMFRIRRNGGNETLEFVGFKPIFESEEWELFHINKHLEDGFGRIVMKQRDLAFALNTGLGSIEIDTDEFNSDEDYKFDTIYTKLTDELEANELRLIENTKLTISELQCGEG